MKKSTGISLSLMMFLEYFIWGSWYATLATYMKRPPLESDGGQIGNAYGALAIATMISPFIVGLIADRYFAAQKIMGILHLLGAVILYFAGSIQDNTLFYWVVLIYSILYMPTIALSNSIAFNQITDPGKQFPWIRVFGTLGWIIAGLVIGNLGWGNTNYIFLVACGASAVLGLYSFFLPNTPPKADKNVSAAKAFGAEALGLFKNKAYLIFFIAAVLICIPLSFYYGFTSLFLEEKGMKDPGGQMIFGQVSEALFILAIPFLFNSIGVKKMLIIGMLAWILRYVAFAYGDMDSGTWLLYAGIILHGICYDFFFVTGYMYTEKKAGEKIKSAAQGLFTFGTYGLGMVIGTWFSGRIVDHYTAADKSHNWPAIWYVPVYIAVAVLIYFIIFFREKKEIDTKG